MIISPFTPLHFRRADAKREGDGIESRYVQTFARTDSILVECITTPDEDFPELYLVQEDVSNEWLMEPRRMMLNESTWVHFSVLHGLSPGAYRIEERANGMRSNTFRVTDDAAELARTTLIQYSMIDNRQRTDAVFLIDGMRYFFDFRVPGGFKAGDTTFGCENEQFRTRQGDICTLYSTETVLKKFTLGSQIGVPVWFAEMLNRLLTCTYVYFDGVRYERNEGSTPEVNVQMEGLDSFVYKIQLQKVAYLDPTIENGNLAILRRKDGATGFMLRYRATDNNNNRITY